MSEYFPKPKSLGANVGVKLDLPNCTTKADLKDAAGVDTSDLANKTDLANLKSDVNRLDIDIWKNIPSNLCNFNSNVDNLGVDKLVPVPVDLSKLSNVVKSDAVKRLNMTEYDNHQKIDHKECILQEMIDFEICLFINKQLGRKKIKAKVLNILLPEI